MKTVVHSLAEMDSLAANIVSRLITSSSTAHIIGLSGNLGAGKTTFTQALARALGIDEPVTSPTFIIEKIYKTSGSSFEHLIHIDAYRLEKPEELEKLGWKMIVENPKNLIVIEWPEKIADLLPKEMDYIYFSHIDESTREITFNYGQS